MSLDWYLLTNDQAVALKAYLARHPEKKLLRIYETAKHTYVNIQGQYKDYPPYVEKRYYRGLSRHKHWSGRIHVEFPRWKLVD